MQSSFRDPAGALFAADGRIFRIVTPAGMADLSAFLASAPAAQWTGSGAVVRSTVLADGAYRDVLARPGVGELYQGIGGEAILEHERIPFPSFPYEWPAEMLHAAAALTLELSLSLAPEGFGLKDATPYNVLFRGPTPVFIDVLSFERRDAGDPTWLPAAQFIRTFLLPLLAHRRFGLPLDQVLLTRRDGLEPEEVYRWLGRVERLRAPYLSLISMPVWLGKRKAAQSESLYQKKSLKDPEQARFILTTMLKGMRRKLNRLAPPAGQSSTWTGYMASNNNYTASHFEAKQKFVAECLREFAPRKVLDVGCNTGHFSFQAARAGAQVVAIDYDPTVAGAVWRTAAAEKLDVLPLAVNLTRPTPGVGWNNREWPSFLDRAEGAFDAVLMLAVVHHMLVTERVPLDQIVDLAARLTTDLLVVEFVSPEDSMFRHLARGRDELYRGLDAPAFERSFRRRFEIVRSQHLEGTTRWLYVMRRT